MTSYFRPVLVLSMFGLAFSNLACSADDPASTDTGSGGSGTGSTASGGNGSTLGSGAQTSSGAGPSSTGGGSGTGGSATGGATSGGGCADADILCETFDSGAIPTGGKWSQSTCYASGYSMKVENSGKAGTGALVTTGVTSGVDSCALKYDLTGIDKYYVAVLFKITGAAPASEHEVTFFEIGANKDSDDPELRMGYRGDSSCNNSGSVYAGWELGATKGPGGEYTGCTGTVPSPETWYCVEVSVDHEGATFVADMTIGADGAAAMDMSYLVHSQPKETVLGEFNANFLKLGMQSYSGELDGLVIDQVAISTTPIGCGN